MKKIIILTCACLSAVLVSNAQSFHLGLKGGADLHKIDGSSFKDQFNAGYHAGAFAEIGLPGKIGLQPEAYFSQVNTTTRASVGSVFGFSGITKVKLSYLNFPILLNLPLAPTLSLQAGPQFGILMDKNKTLAQNGKEAFKSGDVGIAAGLQINLTKLKIYGRYIAGLNDVNNDNSNNNKWHNQVITIGAGFRLF